MYARSRNRPEVLCRECFCDEIPESDEDRRERFTYRASNFARMGERGRHQDTLGAGREVLERLRESYEDTTWGDTNITD